MQDTGGADRPSRLRRACPGLAAGLGWLGTFVYLEGGAHAARLPAGISRAVVAWVAALVVLGPAGLAGARLLGDRASPTASPAGHLRAVAAGLAQVWPAAVPLAALPLATAAPRLGAALALAAMVVFQVRLARLGPPAGAARGAARPALGAWEIALLGVVLATVVLYLNVVRSADSNFQNDSAYHFGVARHIARTGRFEEPIVWHFLSAPASTAHAPFDYWGGLTSLFLTPFLACFGATHATACAVMALVSAASVAVFWYLLCAAIPLRSPAAQALGLVTFALSPALAAYRFDTESLPLFHLLLVASLAAFARGRLVVSVALAFGLVLTRGDGVVTFGLVLAAACASAARAGPGRRRELWRIGGASAALVGAYVAYHLLVFGSPTPPGAAAAPFLAQEIDLYRFGVGRVASFDFVTWRYVASRAALVLHNLRETAFTPGAQDVWLALALVPAVVGVARRSAVHGLTALLLLAGPFLVACASHAVFAPWRTLYTFQPVVALAGALGLDELLAWLERVRLPRLPAGAGAVLGAACAFAVAYALLADLRLYTPDYQNVLRRQELELRALDPLLGGQPVASDRPWYVIANTSSPAVMIPENGGAAMEAALRRYEVRWLVLVGNYAWMRESRGVLAALQRSGSVALGDLRIERVRAGAKVQVYAVREASGAAPAP
jgi:hypothetical protein